ncbi:hypothetical protein [Neoroseomonas terrae]|uniref:hypothetical protein n=1 Tax=Neoroseomonas terrae TaxID=424799 RepID=UPI001BAC52ED|nr:hypothetical protein [Neoroseomonas terrae]
MLLALLLAAAEAPADSITRYCGGGATGGGGGLRLDADGSATTLRRPRAGAPLVQVPTESGTTYAEVARLLEAARFERLARGEPSNMTCSITWQRGGWSHQVRWGIGRVPAALQPAFRALEMPAR